MSDATTTPILSAAGLTAAPSAPAAEAPPAAPVAPSVVAPVAAPDAPAAPPVAPPRLNPWARRAPAPIAPVAASPIAALAAAPAVAEDPRVATLTAQMTSLHAVIRAQADDALSTVPANVRGVVESLAGDDPARRLEVLRTLRAQGLATSPAQVPPGATTMQPAVSPSSPAPVSPEAAVLAQYEQLRAGGSPIAAAAFRAANYAAITRAEAARN